jgi:hypothetical protein
MMPDVKVMAISDDGKYLASSPISGVPTIKNYDIEKNTDETLVSIKKHNLAFTYFTSLKFFHKDKLIAGSFDFSTKTNTVQLYNTSTKIMIKEFKNLGDSFEFLAIVSDDQKYLATSNKSNSITLWDYNSKEKLATLDGDASAVCDMHFSKDGKYIISIGRDGAVRYWDIAQKKEVLANYSFDDGEYISITPEGYFDASTNATQYLSIQTAPMEVVSIDQYYETFFRPDIVAEALTQVPDKYYTQAKPKLQLSDVKPAPEVEIVNTPTKIDNDELEVVLKIIPKAGNIGQIRLYVDGTLIKTDTSRALKRKHSGSILKTYALKLSNGEHTIKALVYNEANTMASKEATLRVTSSFVQTSKPNIYAVVVGINNYNNPAISLNYAVADAKLFANTIKSTTKDLYGEVHIKLLTSKKKTSKENIINSLKALYNISPNDLFVFFAASHGMVEDAKYYMITSNVGALSSRGIKKEAISQDQLRDIIANIPTSKKFIVLDTCNSGALGKTLEVAFTTRGLNEITAMKVLSRAVGSTIISASSSTQEALEGYKNHGLLTYVLASGLLGKADSDKDGYIKTLEIANYVEDTVPQIAQKEFNRAQYPFISPLGQGFPLVRVKKK